MADVAVEARGFDLFGYGSSLDEAMGDLADELAAYARRFFERADFYSHTDRARHYPWLLRFAMLDSREAAVELLLADADSAGRRAREEAVSVR